MQPTGCLRDSACRLRRGGGMVGWGWWCSQVRASSRAPIRCPSGGWRHARGREHYRGEPGSTLLSGGYAPDSAKAEGSSIVDEPGEGWTPVRENHRLEPGGFWGKSWSLTTVIFLPTRATRSGERARFVGLFQECTGLWTAGCWLARRLHQFKASTTMDLGISIFLISVQNVWPWETWTCWSKLVGFRFFAENAGRR